jgi:hypothetical protein
LFQHLPADSGENTKAFAEILRAYLSFELFKKLIPFDLMHSAVPGFYQAG